MAEIVRILRRSIAQGIQGTHAENRILGPQSGGFQAALHGGRLLDSGMLNTMILYVSALMEVKSAMGVIVAAPTAGSCGGLPGAVIGAAERMGLSEEHMAHAMLAAGMIGVFICARSTFAAEVCGCMAECGSGSGMAAAALVTLAGGSAQQAVDAASMALQNTLGMICDPVANRVEVPCLGKNVLAASNALACANMALAGYDAVIPLDERSRPWTGSARVCPWSCAAPPSAGCRSPRPRRRSRRNSRQESPGVDFSTDLWLALVVSQLGSAEVQADSAQQPRQM